MSFNTQLLVVLLSVAALTAGSLFDEHVKHLDEAGLRIRRKIGQYTGLGPIEYMENLRKNMSTPSGTPTDIDNAPTSIWCLLDKDVLEDKYHPKPQNKRCKMQQEFHFNLTSLTLENTDSLPLSLAKMRTYIQPVDRLLPGPNKTVTIEVSIYTRRFSSGNKSLCSGSQLAAQKFLQVDKNFQGQWIEWNITEGIINCWDNSTEMDFLEIAVSFSLVQCESGYKKVPIYVIDPATVPLEQENRREKYWQIQPIVILFLNNEEERKEIKESLKAATPNYPVFATDESNRSKRSLSVPRCQLNNLTVTFAEINLHYILIPYSYNAFQCSGSCAHSHISRSESSNHARIMAAMDYYHKTGRACCTAVEHLPLTVLELKGTSVVTRSYPNMVAKRCECRG